MIIVITAFFIPHFFFLPLHVVSVLELSVNKRRGTKHNSSVLAGLTVWFCIHFGGYIARQFVFIVRSGQHAHIFLLPMKEREENKLEKITGDSDEIQPFARDVVPRCPARQMAAHNGNRSIWSDVNSLGYCLIGSEIRNADDIVTQTLEYMCTMYILFNEFLVLLSCCSSKRIGCYFSVVVDMCVGRVVLSFL